MNIDAILAEWPWLIGYLVVSALVFLVLRRTSSTDRRAAMLAANEVRSRRRLHEFAGSTTLGEAGREFVRLHCSKALIALAIGGWTVRLVVGEWNLYDVLVFAGVLAFWPLQEWLIHVFLLHAKPFELRGRRFEPIVARNHRNHHLHPWDAQLGITPPHILWLYLTGVPGLWLLLLPLPQALSGIAIYFTLVLNYEWIHFLIHTSYPPWSSFYRRLWRNHRLHHFKNEKYWYGVTMLSGDRLLDTQPLPSDTPRSETCLTLGVETEL